MTDFQTKQRQRNLIVGGFVIIAIFAFVFMLIKFRDLPQLVSKFKSFEILVYFPEAPGIQKDTPVQFCGYQIGRVRKVAYPKRDTTQDGHQHKVGVSIAIDKRYTDIPNSIEVVIMKRGLGSSYIELRDAAEGEPSGYVKDKMVLYGTVSMASEFLPPEVQAKLEDLVDSITALSDNANKVLGDADNQTNIKQTLENITLATAQARETLASVQKFSDAGTEQMDVMGAKVVLVAEQLEGALSDMRQLTARIESGDGTLGKLVNDGRLYENLLESSQELEMTLEQLKQWAAEAREKGIRIKW